MRIRSIILASLLVSACGSSDDAVAQGNAAQPAPPMVWAPVSPPPSPPPVRRAPPPEIVSAIQEAHRTELLLTSGRTEEAIANYRRAVAPPPSGDVVGLNEIRGIHLGVLAEYLIVGGRSDDADALLAEYVAAGRADPRHRRLDQLLRAIDRRLYIASGRGDAGAVVALLEERARLSPSESPLACIAPPYMPDVIAPMQHDPRVRAALHRFGCDDDVIDQIDRLAQEPIGMPSILPAPGRRRVPAGGRSN